MKTLNIKTSVKCYSDHPSDRFHICTCDEFPGIEGMARNEQIAEILLLEGITKELRSRLTNPTKLKVLGPNGTIKE